MRRAIAVIALSLLGCTTLKPGTDVRRDDGGQLDGGPRDAGQQPDGGPNDGGPNDGGADPDSGARDAGTDAGIHLDVQQLALGGAHTCLLDVAGRVICWGANGQGQLARPPSAVAEAAVVEGLGAASAICAGGVFTCALVGAEVFCWGGNASGQLGDGLFASREAPTRVASLPAVTSIACGFDIACAVRDGGELYCWGDNSTAQIDPALSASVATPAQVALDGPVVGALAVGANHSCAVLRMSTTVSTYCWGGNSAAQIDTSGDTPVQTPRRISAVGAPLLSVGAVHTCAHTGTMLACRGAETRDGSVGPQVTTAPVVGSAVGLESGADFSCAHTGDELVCWGEQMGLQLGAMESAHWITEVSPPIELISLGSHHACAVDAAGILCWGANGMRQVWPGFPSTVAPRRIPLGPLLEP